MLDSWPPPSPTAPTRAPAFCSGLSPHGVLKLKRCSRLNEWIVSAFCSGLSPRRALCVMYWTRGLSPRSVTDRPRINPKTGKRSKLDPLFCLLFLTQWYCQHTSKESVSPVCKFFSSTWVTAPTNFPHIVPFGKLHRIGGVPPKTFPNVKSDAPEEVGGNRKCFDSPIRKWGLVQIINRPGVAGAVLQSASLLIN